MPVGAPFPANGEKPWGDKLRAWGQEVQEDLNGRLSEEQLSAATAAGIAGDQYEEGMTPRDAVIAVAGEASPQVGVAVIRFDSDPDTPRADPDGSPYPAGTMVLWVGHPGVDPVYAIARDTVVHGDPVPLPPEPIMEPDIDWMARYRAADLELADGASVASWEDASGNGNALTQATISQQPVYHVAAGGEPAYVQYAGDRLPSGAFSSPVPQPWTEMLVCELDTVSTDTTTYIVMGSETITAAAQLQQLGDGGIARLRIYAGNYMLDTTHEIVPGERLVIFACFNGASSFIRVNGTQHSASGIIGSRTLTGVTPFGQGGATTGPTGKLFDAGVRAAVLPLSDMEQFEEWAAVEYGVTLGVD